MTVNWLPLYVVWMLNIEFRFKFGKLRREQKVKNKVIWSPLHCKHRVQVTTTDKCRGTGEGGNVAVSLRGSCCLYCNVSHSHAGSSGGMSIYFKSDFHLFFLIHRCSLLCLHCKHSKRQNSPPPTQINLKYHPSSSVY